MMLLGHVVFWFLAASCSQFCAQVACSVLCEGLHGMAWKSHPTGTVPVKFWSTAAAIYWVSSLMCD